MLRIKRSCITVYITVHNGAYIKCLAIRFFWCAIFMGRISKTSVLVMLLSKKECTAQHGSK